jgi:hypothetical protein
VLSPGEIWKSLNAIYTEISATIDEGNPEVLRHRLTRATEKLPYVALLRANAEYWLDHYTEEETVKVLKESPTMTPTVMRNILKGRLKGHNQVFNFARKLHEDLTTQSRALVTLLSYEKSLMTNLDHAGHPQKRIA